MGEKNKIIVALATYNGEKFIREQLQSISSQIRKPDRVYVHDDGSKDRTIYEIERLKKELNLEIILNLNEKNLGYAANFSGIVEKLIADESLANDDVVFFCDQDDYWFENKIKVIIEIIEKQGIAAATHNVEFADEKLIRQNQTKIEVLTRLNIPEHYYIMGAASAVKLGFLRSMGPVPATCASHDDWYIGAAVRLHSRLMVQQTLSLYRRHNNNSSQEIFNNNKLNLIHYLNFIIKKRQNRLEEIKKTIEYENNFLERLKISKGLVNYTREELILKARLDSIDLISHLRERLLIRELSFTSAFILAVSKLFRDRKYNFKKFITDIIL